MADFDELIKRLERLCSRAEGALEDARLLSEIEDVLAEGYIQALNGEARSRQLGERLGRLAEAPDRPGAAAEVRKVAVQQRSLDRRSVKLRAHLSGLREHFIRLGGGDCARV